MDKWKIISQKRILDAGLFNVDQLKIRFNDKEISHYVAKRRPAVSVFPITENLEIYLVSQYRYLLEQQTLEAMAGFIKKGEAPLAAAKRELKEEIGLTAVYWDELAKIEHTASAFRARAYLFLAKDLKQGDQQQDEDEDITVVKLKLDDAVKKVMIGEINHAASMIGILMLDKLKREGKI